MTDKLGSTRSPSVDIQNLRVEFLLGASVLHAVNGVNLRIPQGEAVALIGESGSGKSVTMRTIMRLHSAPRTRISGKLEVDGKNVLTMSHSALANMRGKEVAMIFQEPLLALDPVYTVGSQIIEAIRRHESVTYAQASARALELFEKVQIPSPERRLSAYPHELSGGMRQRAMIALALACRPKILLADEPTTALDATVQIQILLLLRQLQRDLGLSILFVTHDIDVAVEVADRIAVMYAGHIVEEGLAADLISRPRHPYTLALLRSRSHVRTAKGARLQTIPGGPPDLSNLPPGCGFAPRCHFVKEQCWAALPPTIEVAANHRVSCSRVEAAALAAAP